MAKKASGPKQRTRKRYLRGTAVLVERVVFVVDGHYTNRWRTTDHGIYIHERDTELRGSAIMPTT